MAYEDVRATVLKCINAKLVKAGLDPQGVLDDLDLLRQGIVDSFDYINLIDELEECLGVEIDMAALDDNSMTTLGGLSRQIAKICENQEQAR